MVVALAFVVSAAADVGSGSGPPTSIGTGGAASSVEELATQAESMSCAAAGTLSTPRSPRRRCSASPSRSRAESAAEASWFCGPPGAL